MICVIWAQNFCILNTDNTIHLQQGATPAWESIRWGCNSMGFLLLDNTSWFLSSGRLPRNHSKNSPGFILQLLILLSFTFLPLLHLGSTWRLAFSFLHLPCFQTHRSHDNQNSHTWSCLVCKQSYLTQEQPSSRMRPSSDQNHLCWATP